MSFNQINLIGRLGQDVEVKQTDKTKIATFSVATDRRRGKEEKKTTWFRVTAFGKLAEFAEMYFSKGSSIYVSGELVADEWTDKQGGKRTSLEVVADKINFLPKSLDVAPVREDENIGQQPERMSHEPAPFDGDVSF